MSAEHVITEVQVVGTLSEKRTSIVVFPNFADLPYQVGNITMSDKIRSHGKEWFVAVYPGGYDNDSAGFVGLALLLAGDDRNVKAKFTVRVPACSREAYYIPTHNFKGTTKKQGRGWAKFFKRNTLLQSNALQDGALEVFVDIQVWTNAPPTLTPKGSNLSIKRPEMLQSEDLSGVTFTVGGEKICAHRVLLKSGAPTLFALAEDSEEVLIDDIDPALFRSFVRFLYSEEITNDVKENGRDMLVIADRFGCTMLKLMAESELVSLLDSSNAAGFFLLADSHSCPVLREAAFNYIMNHKTEVTQSSSWSEILKTDDLMREITNGWFPGAPSVIDDSEDGYYSGDSTVDPSQYNELFSLR